MSKFLALQRLNQPWLISHQMFGQLRDTINAWDDNLTAEMPEEDSYSEINGIALLSLKGTMMKNPTAIERVFLGATCTGQLCASINEIGKNPNIKGVLLDVDSGGGSVQGVIEASEALRGLHEQKPVVTFTDGMMASASYWVGSQATTIVASPSARVGSIGVYVPVIDYKEQYAEQGINVEVITNKDGIYKGAGLEGTSLTDEQKAQIQDEVEDIYGEFKNSVLSSRSIPNDAMQGQAFMGKRATEKNLIDAVGDFEDAIYLLGQEMKNRA